MKLAPHGPPRYWEEDAAPGLEDSPALPGCALLVVFDVVEVVEAAAVVWVSLPTAAPMDPAFAAPVAPVPVAFAPALPAVAFAAVDPSVVSVVSAMTGTGVPVVRAISRLLVHPSASLVW
jgi:hypothetical protein